MEINLTNPQKSAQQVFILLPVSFLGTFFVGIILLVCFLDGTVLLVKISVGRIARCDIL